jgi:membrane associated rhomboid family serine protease
MFAQLSAAPITLMILLVNFLIGLYTFRMDPSLITRMSLRPVRVQKNGEYYRLLTGGFVHAGWAHLAFNLITLYFFGPVLEWSLGTIGYVILYFGSGLLANGFAYFIHRKEENYSAVGASGAIAGVVCAFALFNPAASIYLFAVVPMPAWLFAVAFIGFSIYAMRRTFDGQMGRIAHDAHLGGAVGGILLTILLRPDVVRTFFQHLGI